jgi:high-affinity Fe2+/Pb2+ permease
MYHEKNKLIQAKIRAIIATAVFGAAFAVTLGALIAATTKSHLLSNNTTPSVLLKK